MAQQPQPSALVFHPRSRRHHHHHRAEYDVTSSSSSTTSSDDSSVYYLRHPRRRRRWRWPWGPPVTLGHPALVSAPPAAVITQTQPPPLPPRQYGYRRFHYQGGERRLGVGGHHQHQHHHHHRAHHCGRRRCVPRQRGLTRCCRWLFGDLRGRYCCDGRSESGDCCTGTTSSPTRHYEDEYWGPGRGSMNNSNDWAYGPNGWRNCPWRYGGPGGGGGYPNVGPGGTIEEIEEGGRADPTAATAAVPVAAAAATGVLACDQGAQHNHYHLDPGRDHGRGGRGRDRYRDRDRDRRDGFLGLMDRERDREMDRHIINQDALNAREGRTLALLDRERDRDRDRGNTTVMDLLDRELNRQRSLRPGKDADDRDDDSKEGQRERAGGLRREIEALRKDLSRLTASVRDKTSKSLKKKREGSSTHAGRVRDRGAASQSPRRPKSPAVGNNITFDSRTDTDEQNSEDNEEDDDSVDGENLSSGGVRANGQDVRARGRSVRSAGTMSASPD